MPRTKGALNQDTEDNALMLWEYVHNQHDPHKCEVRSALRFSNAQIRRLSKYLVDTVGYDVILPSGMSAEAHVDPETEEDCHCGSLQLGYGEGVAESWYDRRLTILEGHANNMAAVGQRLVAQFPKSKTLKALREDLRRVQYDILQAREDPEAGDDALEALSEAFRTSK